MEMPKLMSVKIYLDVPEAPMHDGYESNHLPIFGQLSYIEELIIDETFALIRAITSPQLLFSS
jgi:hypothetical protein